MIEAKPYLYRSVETAELLGIREGLRWNLAELGALWPDSECGEECLESAAAVTRLDLADVDAEIEWRRRLAGRRQAPEMDGRVNALNRIQTVKERVELVMFCDRHYPMLRRAGRDSWFAVCPFPDHNEATGSFHVTPSKRLWHCFGCQRSGDVISLARYFYQEESVMRCVERLEREFGLEPRQQAA